jgi:hypothetical protein
MSLFSAAPPAVIPSDSLSTVPLTVVRQIIKEVSENRASNLAFRQAVADHEAANSKVEQSPQPAPSRPKLRGSGGGRGGGSGSMQPANRSDLRIRPPSQNIPKSVPRKIQNQVVWDVTKIDTNITVPTSGLVETNFTFSLLLHPQYTYWAALYDQWCCPQASVTFRSEQAPGATFTSVALYTALDFDGVGALGSVASIEDYGTCTVTEMSPGRSVTRSIRPCTKLSTQQSGSNVNSGLIRQWQDTGAAGTPWFGIRSIANASSTSYNIRATTTIYLAFRNGL